MTTCHLLFTNSCPFAGIGACCNSVTKPTEEQIEKFEYERMFLDYFFTVPLGSAQMCQEGTNGRALPAYTNGG